MTTPLTPMGAAPLGPQSGVPAVPVQAVPPKETSRVATDEGARGAVHAQRSLLEPKPKEGTTALPDKKTLEKAAADVKAYFKASSSELRYQEDKETGQIVIKIIDPSTREVIRQIPSEEIVTLARKLRQLAKNQESRGALLDEQG